MTEQQANQPQAQTIAHMLSSSSSSSSSSSLQTLQCEQWRAHYAGLMADALLEGNESGRREGRTCFVFDTTLANEAAQAVSSGGFRSIVQYHIYKSLSGACGPYQQMWASPSGFAGGLASSSNLRDENSYSGTMAATATVERGRGRADRVDWRLAVLALRRPTTAASSTSRPARSMSAPMPSLEAHVASLSSLPAQLDLQSGTASSSSSSGPKPALQHNSAPSISAAAPTWHQLRLQFADDFGQLCPPLSYVALIVLAILSVEGEMVTQSDIREFIMRQFPFYRNRKITLQSCIRHTLDRNECFIRLPRKNTCKVLGYCFYWTLKLDSLDTLGVGFFSQLRQLYAATRQ